MAWVDLPKGVTLGGRSRIWVCQRAMCMAESPRPVEVDGKEVCPRCRKDENEISGKKNGQCGKIEVYTDYN